MLRYCGADPTRFLVRRDHDTDPGCQGVSSGAIGRVRPRLAPEVPLRARERRSTAEICPAAVSMLSTVEMPRRRSGSTALTSASTGSAATTVRCSAIPTSTTRTSGTSPAVTPGFRSSSATVVRTRSRWIGLWKSAPQLDTGLAGEVGHDLLRVAVRERADKPGGRFVGVGVGALDRPPRGYANRRREARTAGGPGSGSRATGLIRAPAIRRASSRSLQNPRSSTPPQSTTPIRLSGRRLRTASGTISRRARSWLASRRRTASFSTLDLPVVLAEKLEILAENLVHGVALIRPSQGGADHQSDGQRQEDPDDGEAVVTKVVHGVAGARVRGSGFEWYRDQGPGIRKWQSSGPETRDLRVSTEAMDGGARLPGSSAGGRASAGGRRSAPPPPGSGGRRMRRARRTGAA